MQNHQLSVNVSDTFVLNASWWEETMEETPLGNTLSRRLIHPPEPTMYDQVFRHLEAISRTARIPPKSQLNFGEVALATIAVCLRWGTGIDPILGIVRIVRAQLMMGEKVAHADELQQRIPKRHAQQWHLIPHGTVS